MPCPVGACIASGACLKAAFGVPRPLLAELGAPLGANGGKAGQVSQVGGVTHSTGTASHSAAFPQSSVAMTRRCTRSGYAMELGDPGELAERGAHGGAASRMLTVCPQVTGTCSVTTTHIPFTTSWRSITSSAVTVGVASQASVAVPHWTTKFAAELQEAGNPGDAGGWGGAGLAGLPALVGGAGGAGTRAQPARTGGVVSWTVMVWLCELWLPQRSVAVQVRR